MLNSKCAMFTIKITILLIKTCSFTNIITHQHKYFIKMILNHIKMTQCCNNNKSQI